MTLDLRCERAIHNWKATKNILVTTTRTFIFVMYTTHTHTHTHTYTHAHTHTHTHTHSLTHTHTHTHTQVHTPIWQLPVTSKRCQKHFLLVTDTIQRRAKSRADTYTHTRTHTHAHMWLGTPLFSTHTPTPPKKRVNLFFSGRDPETAAREQLVTSLPCCVSGKVLCPIPQVCLFTSNSGDFPPQPLGRRKCSVRGSCWLCGNTNAS